MSSWTSGSCLHLGSTSAAQQQLAVQDWASWWSVVQTQLDPCCAISATESLRLTSAPHIWQVHQPRRVCTVPTLLDYKRLGGYKPDS
eukprot:3644213-Rhodomonas_salina.2